MAYDAEKDLHNSTVYYTSLNKDYLNGKTLGDDETGGPRFVTSCVVHFSNSKGDRETVIGSQQCHAFLNSVRYRIFEGTDIVVTDRIQGATRKQIIEKQVNDEEAIFYLQYFMDHELFKNSFLEHDAKTALNERIMVRDICTLPSNQCMFAIIATRGLWEGYQRKLPRRMFNLVGDGIKPDLAYILSYYIDKTEDGKYVGSQNSCCGHTTIRADTFTVDALRNYLKHVAKNTNAGTMKTNSYNGVSELFGVEYSTSDPFDKRLVKNYISDFGRKGDVSPTKYDISALKELQDILYA